MSASRVQTWSAMSSAAADVGISRAFGSSVTAGSLLVAITTSTNDENMTVSDNVNGSWTNYYKLYNATFQRSFQVSFFANAASGSTTVTATGTFGGYNITLAEYGGMATSSPGDGTATSTATSPPSGGTIATTTDGAQICFGAVIGSALNPNSPFTEQLDTTVGYNYVLADYLTPSSGSYTCTWDTNQSFSFMISSAFKAAASGVSAALGGSASTSGLGTQAPGISIGL